MKKVISLPDLHVLDFNGQQHYQQKTLKHHNNLWKQDTEVNNILISIQLFYQLSPTKTVALDQTQLQFCSMETVISNLYKICSWIPRHST